MQPSIIESADPMQPPNVRGAQRIGPTVPGGMRPRSGVETQTQHDPRTPPPLLAPYHWVVRALTPNHYVAELAYFRDLVDAERYLRHLAHLLGRWPGLHLQAWRVTAAESKPLALYHSRDGQWAVQLVSHRGGLT